MIDVPSEVAVIRYAAISTDPPLCALLLFTDKAIRLNISIAIIVRSVCPVPIIWSPKYNVLSEQQPPTLISFA